MLGNEARNEKCGNAKHLAIMFNVKERTVYRLVAQKRNTGSVELKTSTRGRKPKVNEDQIRQILLRLIKFPIYSNRIK